MIKRLYIHNFRCFENFEVSFEGKPSTLLIGRNGAGKSTIRHALALLQAIARGTNHVGALVGPRDFFLHRSDAPMRFELDVSLGGRLYHYELVLELPAKAKALRVKSERFTVDGRTVYSRASKQVTIGTKSPAVLLMDWHMIAFPIIEDDAEHDELSAFKLWLARSILLAPIPTAISGESTEETLEPVQDASNLGAWFSAMISHAPSAYGPISEYLKEVLVDFLEVKNPNVGTESRALSVLFRRDSALLSLPFASLSDGEKCFFICAMILAANRTYGPLLCFWDEPDSHLSLDEVSQFITALRREFEAGGQMIVTSHNPETVRRFSRENTLLLFRRGHLEPTRPAWLDGVDVRGDLVNALIMGDVEP